MATREADPRCAKLKFRDWLLTIVQRCPRYLLLLKDLIENTSTEDAEYQPLLSVHTLVSKSTSSLRCIALMNNAPALTTYLDPTVTESLNASLHVHAQTLELIAIQRSTANLPFQLITPGRTFLKRGPLLQVVGSAPKEREFLLFSDCIIWIASAEKDAGDGVGKWDLLQPDRKSQDGLARPKTLVRTRSKSDADLPRFLDVKKRESGLKLRLGGPKKNMKRLSSAGTEDRWIYKGHIDLVDVEVVAGSAVDEGSPHRFEILSPHTSFACYTGRSFSGSAIS